MKNSYKSLDNLFTTVGNNHNTSPAVVKKVYESVFSLIRDVLRGLPDMDSITVDEMKDLRTNFYMSKFGRFYIDIEKIRKKRELKIRKYGKR